MVTSFVMIRGPAPRVFGARLLMGHRTLEGQVVDPVLARFAARPDDVVRAYRVFVEAGVALGRQPERVGGGLRRSLEARGGDGRHRQAYDERIIGSGAVVEALWKEGALEEDPTPTPSLEALTQRVAAVELLRQRRPQHLSGARAAICYLAVRLLGYRAVEVGR